jgi:broad specificity phosphatase PhoE
MTFATQRRTPFFIPIWLTVLAACFGLTCVATAAWVWGTADATTVVVIRHAEKQPSGVDPPLTPAGEARAALLSHMFGEDELPGARIEAIYVNPSLRSRLTAAPLAARLNLVPIVAPPDARGLVRRVLREHAGARVLIVGRKDTVPAIVEALSGTGKVPDVADDEYGTMYIVSVPKIGRSNVLRVSY